MALAGAVGRWIGAKGMSRMGRLGDSWVLAATHLLLITAAAAAGGIPAGLQPRFLHASGCPWWALIQWAGPWEGPMPPPRRSWPGLAWFGEENPASAPNQTPRSCLAAACQPGLAALGAGLESALGQSGRPHSLELPQGLVALLWPRQWQLFKRICFGIWPLPH